MCDKERQKLFGILIRPVVVAGAGYKNRQAIGVMVGRHQVIGCRFTGRIRASWGKIRLFGRISSKERTIDFIGRYLQKSFNLGSARLFQEHLDADDIRVKKWSRVVDRAVDV